MWPDWLNPDEISVPSFETETTTILEIQISQELQGSAFLMKAFTGEFFSFIPCYFIGQFSSN